jgi:hypothetical protein
MTEIQNMQNTQQQEQATQQQKYINRIKYTFEETINGVLGAEVQVYFTADLVKELNNRKIYFRYDTFGIEKIYSDNKQVNEYEVERIIKEAAIKKAEQTGEQKEKYTVVLDVNDVITVIDEIIRKKEEEIKRREEEIKRREEEKRKMIEEIREIIKQIPSELVEFHNVDHAYVYFGEVRKYLHFSEDCTYDDVKESYEKLKATSVSELINLRMLALKKQLKKLEKDLEEYMKEIETLKRIIRKLTDEEELESRLEELEEEKENELTTEEIKYLLNKVF